MDPKRYPIDGRTHWWLPASLCFGPVFMAFIPRIVESDLLQFLLTLTGVTMQAAVNLYLYRKVRENEYELAEWPTDDAEPVDAGAKP